MTEAVSNHPAQELLSRLRVIEEQPLDARIDAYAAVHDELVARLESGPRAESA